MSSRRIHPLLVTGVAPALPLLIGSVINIWYNLTNIEPLLTPAQRVIFVRTTIAYNVTVYPLGAAVWIWLLVSLRGPFREQMRGGIADERRRLRAQRLVINLPWWGVALATLGWALCVPVFLLVLGRGAEPVTPMLYAHLPVSFAISGLIAITHGFFSIELLSHRLLYPVFFRDTRPATTPGALALSLRGRGILIAISAGVCPVVSLLLLTLVPRDPGNDSIAFALAVGVWRSCSHSSPHGCWAASSPPPSKRCGVRHARLRTAISTFASRISARTSSGCSSTVSTPWSQICERNGASRRTSAVMWARASRSKSWRKIAA